MKINPNILCNILLFSTLLFVSNKQAFGQQKLSLSTGIGLPELINCGIHYRTNQIQFGGSVGTFPTGSLKVLSITGDISYYFASYSEAERKQTYFCMIGVNYFQQMQNTSYSKTHFLNLRIGRNYKLSEKFYIKLDIGIFMQLAHENVGFWDFTPIASLGFGASLHYDLW